YFFFQAEDGIRYRNVTGVQTCALPISSSYTNSYVASFAIHIPLMTCSILSFICLSTLWSKLRTVPVSFASSAMALNEVPASNFPIVMTDVANGEICLLLIFHICVVIS